MTQDRNDKLNDMDFDWKDPNLSSKWFGRNNVLWNQRYEELKEYQAKYGENTYPSARTPGLGFWAQNQRQGYKNKAQWMTQDRIDKLNQVNGIDYDWVSPYFILKKAR